MASKPAKVEEFKRMINEFCVLAQSLKRTVETEEREASIMRGADPMPEIRLEVSELNSAKIKPVLDTLQAKLQEIVRTFKAKTTDR